MTDGYTDSLHYNILLSCTGRILDLKPFRNMRICLMFKAIDPLMSIFHWLAFKIQAKILIFIPPQEWSSKRFCSSCPFPCPKVVLYPKLLKLFLEAPSKFLFGISEPRIYRPFFNVRQLACTSRKLLSSIHWSCRNCKYCSELSEYLGSETRGSPSIFCSLCCNLLDSSEICWCSPS